MAKDSGGHGSEKRGKVFTNPNVQRRHESGMALKHGPTPGQHRNRTDPSKDFPYRAYHSSGSGSRYTAKFFKTKAEAKAFVDKHK